MHRLQSFKRDLGGRLKRYSGVETKKAVITREGG
jgi:hypothetical protein